MESEKFEADLAAAYAANAQMNLDFVKEFASMNADDFRSAADDTPDGVGDAGACGSERTRSS